MRAHLKYKHQWLCFINLQLSYQSMFRLICLSPLFSFAAQTSNSAKYIIKNSAYLVEAPPKRPTNAYALFLKDEFTGKKNLKLANAGAQANKRWKLYPEIQEKYHKLATEKNAGYQALKKEYEKKCVIPFKRITSHTLRLSHLFRDKKITLEKGEGIKGVGYQVKKALEATRTLEGDKNLAEEAKKINDERDALKKAYQFPALPYSSLRSYQIRHSTPEAQRGPNYNQELEAAYNAELEAWKGNVKKWLEEKKYGLSIEQFLELYENDENAKAKKTKKTKKDNESEDQ